MKIQKILFILGAILLSLLVTGSVLACEPDIPDPPTCPSGMEEYAPPEWIPEECNCPTFEYTYTWTDWVWDWDTWEWVLVERHGDTYQVTYNKSNDPNKCHRPSTHQLRELGMSCHEARDFQENHPQYVDIECEGGYWTGLECIPAPEHQTIYFDPDCTGVMAQNQTRVWEGGPDGDWGEWQNDGDPYMAHEWDDPFTTEEYEGVTEPSECLWVRDYKKHQAVDCSGVHRVINLYEGPVGDLHVVETLHNELIPFILMYTQETVDEETVPVPDEYGPDYTFPAVEEPASCVVSLPSLSVGSCMMGANGPWVMNAHASGSSAHWRLKRYGSGEILDLGVISAGGSASAQTNSAGTWVKQFFNEDTGAWQQRGGTHVTATNQWPEQACPGTHDYSVRVIVKNDCDGWMRKVNLRDFGSWSAVLYVETGTWDDPYVLETEPGLTFDVPDQYGVDDVVFEAINEPADCLVSLEHAVNLNLDNNCDGWSIEPTTANGTCEVTGAANGTWSDPYITEEATTGYSCVWDDEFEATQSVTIDEPASCLTVLDHDGTVTFGSTCRGWFVILNDDEGGKIISADPGLNGGWSKKYRREKVTVTVVVQWPDGHTETFTEKIKEPSNCVEAEPAFDRPMWLLEGYDGRWCLLISDSHPSVEQQNYWCFPCDDPDWHAINAPCADYVYDDGTEYGAWSCDSILQAQGFSIENSRLNVDDLIRVNNHTYDYTSCEEMGCIEE